VKLPYFQERDDDQEDPIDVEKKEELGEEANPENIMAVIGLSTAPSRLSIELVDNKIQRRETISAVNC